MTHDDKVLILQIVDAMLEAIRDFGDAGAPAGPLYLACMTGCNMPLAMFEQIMRCLIAAGKVRECNHTYFIVRRT